MKFRIDIIVFAGLVLATSCRSTQDTTADKAGKTKNSNPACRVTDESKPQIKWYAETDEVLKGKEVIVLPAVYSIYSADSAEMKTFFTTAKNSSEDNKIDVVIPLPQPIGCKIFSVYPSGTMSAELQKKFPDIVALKGKDKASGIGEVRLEYNGKMMQGQVTWNSEIYMVVPVSNNNRFYYVVYDKSATMEIKKDFEKPLGDKTAPQQPQILRYDR